MNILGIESTAHTFGVGIVTDEGKVLANAVDSYTSKDIGMIPHEMAEHHNKVAEKLLKQALKDANVSWGDIEFIAYSAGPGLDPALWAGYHIAKKWAEENGKKLVGVNHCAAHLSIGKVWNKLKDPCYLYVSGVNTQIIAYEAGKYRVFGETLDLGLGNMLDKFGRILGLGFPAGPKVEELAKNGGFVELPYTVKGMDFSFSGILTKAEQLLKKGISKEDLCFSVQETCFAILAEATERAMAYIDKKELLLVGGVGANKRFCEMLDIMCKERGAKFYKVPMDLAGDQGAMIAWEGFLRKDESSDIEVNPHWRTDEV
ncbi:tRNA (adenosine(37)-N6)-threonylcarbamoyltransferase complex transferase subunit TsaD [Candidatus Woesearchaeota archaeon]|jgi:N6-L-threonylcarbamoyladenine synthase|nr:tRNA (adenosine(37)-N6)-threonylcarbamoyltransferase complex transferase subunit TsaD [Candidatus Woesearchaeota archaeon]MBT4110740.1 tRNA (adenosine(37)-N6)-threonylcarbamoyltransferase complex transferase subunit TsaD [Candidatus Woesearchaeota archaeon]MBT4336336.1 tRNA (adenosine(37)-N6)-threonylcarbamoyltransferase complex transferase subunit TsaD [Candidatus Woesearchaeota archaeon]MBT4469303.1 tRNA (adenosine(37)-N6)-threonylcarbamoyltransferase complex transferase subunit TsaD [Candi